MLDPEPESTAGDPLPWRKAAMDLVRPVSYEAPPPREESLNYLHLVWRRKYWVAGAALFGAALGLGWVILQIPAFRSSTTVEVVGFNEAFMGLGASDPQGGTG